MSGKKLFISLFFLAFRLHGKINRRAKNRAFGQFNPLFVSSFLLQFSCKDTDLLLPCSFLWKNLKYFYERRRQQDPDSYVSVNKFKDREFPRVSSLLSRKFRCMNEFSPWYSVALWQFCELFKHKSWGNTASHSIVLVLLITFNCYESLNKRKLLNFTKIGSTKNSLRNPKKTLKPKLIIAKYVFVAKKNREISTLKIL